jgi:hypothetical protein
MNLSTCCPRRKLPIFWCSFEVVSAYPDRSTSRQLVAIGCAIVLISMVPAGEPHWAFQALNSGSGSVDGFVTERLKDNGRKLSPAAESHTLIRRLSFDLRGVPPTGQEVAAFEADDSPDAWSRLVQRFLASPQFGERMAQQWLDLARYGDTSGYAADRTRTIWPYRDWVVGAFNENMPFDQFVIEQLAGDLLPDATPEQRLATGFHRNAMQAKGNNPRKEEFRVKGVVDRLTTTGRALLGLSIECAECHDHKYDPVSQREYYRLFAIFNNVPHLGEGYGVHGPRMEYLPPELRLRRLQLQNRLASLPPNRALDPPVRSAERALLETKIAAIEAKKLTVPVMAELDEPRAAHVLVRGNFKEKGELVFPGIPDVLPPLEAGIPVNRLTFAQWLVNENHPLTSRVAVNYLWQHFFGTGLVATSADFGKQGSPPSYPDLLDWLAVEFVRSGWDRKHIVRLIVNSDTYRQSSRSIGAPFFAGMPRLRHSAEQIRDNALTVSGLLCFGIGGPPVFPLQPDGYYEERAQNTAGNSNFTWRASPGEGRYRKTVYMYWKRMALHPSLAAFDAPARQVCKAKRSITNTPQQALVTLNDPIFYECAVAFGTRIKAAGKTDADRIGFAFRECLGRPPDASEHTQFLEFTRNRADTWESVATVLLNLDEFMTRE